MLLQLRPTRTLVFLGAQIKLLFEVVEDVHLGEVADLRCVTIFVLDVVDAMLVGSESIRHPLLFIQGRLVHHLPCILRSDLLDDRFRL